MLRIAKHFGVQVSSIPEGFYSTCLCLKTSYATNAKADVHEPSDGSKQKPLPVKDFLEKTPDHHQTVLNKHAGQVFNHGDFTHKQRITPSQPIYVNKHQIKQTVWNPTTIEDFLYTPPSPTKPFPEFSKLPGIYASLSKSRLTMLVVLTSMGGYALAPGPFDLNTLLLLSVGTWLQSAAANATNQTMEVKYDTQMKRTRDRVLVRGLISREHAAVYVALSGIVGTGLLYWGVNPLTCYIGAANYLLYTSVYTPMKRLSPVNTWVGSVVGALPPIMGWTAATGFVDMGAIWLGTILYIWQFPHFMALSWNVKQDYQRAGYQMSASTNPGMCKRVAFRHTIFMTAVCCLGPTVGATTHMFTVYSLPCNLYGVYLGWKFYSEGDSSASRKLFRFSLVQVPYLLVMMLIAKKWQQDEGTTASKAVAVN